jgi:predicted nucleotidyltransferase
MIRLPPDFLDFIRLLNDHGVEYLIVGGYAVAVYGYVRYTGDIDFFIAINPTNAERMVKVFNLFGLSQPDINADLFMDPGKILRIGSEPMRLEVLNQISGVDFDECYRNRKIIDVEGFPVNFVGYSELLKNKSSTGREKDVADVSELQKRNPEVCGDE